MIDCVNCKKPLNKHSMNEQTICLGKLSLKNWIKTNRLSKISNIQYKVLKFIYENPNTNAYQLSKELKIQNGTTSKIIHKLERLNIIHRLLNKNGYEFLLTVTDLGELILKWKLIQIKN